ncbi:HD domain-containing protein [Labilibacter sediminis]|nr:HD domain-containing protein [Labilibacter sediminis]
MVVIIGFVILKYGVIKSINNKVNNWHQDSIAPILKKYLQSDEANDEENIKLTHKAAVKYEKATVLFADIQGFTKIVEHLNPETLIDELDRFFIHFDEVAEKYKIEKIKTIGDAYMCAGGLPEKNGTNPIEVVLAAIEMQRYMQTTNHSLLRDGHDFWELRIGIHTGSVISGIIGRKKLSFDIWGDTVNIASRMESSGVAGKINVSGITYQLIKDFFVCEYRGKMPIKYKGETDMYFVKGIAPQLSTDGEGVYPNEDFFTKLQWIRYNDLEEVVLGQLKNELSTSLKYHNIKHTLDVCTQVEVIGRSEGLKIKELLLVKTAALFHDTGYMISSLKHEVQSVRIAKEILPHFNYNKSEIEAINQLIMATESNSEPKMLMEMIIKDADLDYLGRPDFIALSDKLWEEICHTQGKISQKEWNKKQYDFLSQHVYYTKTAKELRQVNKEIQMKKIKELLK